MTRKSSDGSKTDKQTPAGEPAGSAAARVPLKLSPDGLILRENFTRERMESLRLEMAEQGDNSLLTHDEREEGRRAFMQRWDGRSDIWVFGYGSLMWNPAIHVAETREAKVFGLHRAFCLHLTLGRGTHKAPGLMLALDRGGSCRGMAHRIAAHQVESETEILWMREMMGGSYVPVWINLSIDGKPARAPAFTFMINRSHHRYAGKLDEALIAQRIALAEGRLGTNRAYLYRTVERLDALGIRDGQMHRLCEQVKSLAGD